MSRRVELPGLPEGHVRTFAAKIVCTGGGRHAPVKIADLATAGLPGGDPSLCWVAYQHGEVMDTWMSAEGHRTWTFTCRRCPSERGNPRTVPLTEQRLIRAVTGLKNSGVSDGRPVLDISWRGLS